MSNLTDFPVVLDINVAWGEMDAFQHVNHTHFFRYFESARVDYFARVKLPEFMENYGKGPILAATDAKFFAPVSYPDTLSVGVRLAELSEGRMVHEYAVFSKTHQRIVAKGQSNLAFFDFKTNQPCAIPQGLADNMTALQPEFAAEKNAEAEPA